MLYQLMAVSSNTGCLDLDWQPFDHKHHLNKILGISEYHSMDEVMITSFPLIQAEMLKRHQYAHSKKIELMIMNFVWDVRLDPTFLSVIVTQMAPNRLQQLKMTQRTSVQIILLPHLIGVK